MSLESESSERLNERTRNQTCTPVCDKNLYTMVKILLMEYEVQLQLTSD